MTDTFTPDDKSLNEPVPDLEKLPRIVIDVTQAECGQEELRKFVKDLATTVSAEIRAIVQTKAPKGEIRIVVSVQ